MYFDIYICIVYDDFMRCHEDTVMLRSTTGPYGRPVIEVAYGKMILSLHRGCMGDDSSKRVIGMSACCIAHARIPGSTLVWAQLHYFLVFMISKPTCIMFLKYIYCIKEHWWSLTSSWPDKVQRMFSTVHEFSKEKSKPQTVLWTFYINFVITISFALLNLWDVLTNSSSTHV